LMKRKYKIILFILLAILGIMLLSIIANYAATMNSLNKEEKSYNKPPNEVYPKFAEISQPGAPPAVLLVHGFGGSPFDFKPLTDELASQGIAFHAILLPGHGTTPRNLKDITEEQMICHALNSLDALKQKYDSVSVAGFSMGGAIAINLAEQREIDQLILFGPYIEITQKWYYPGKPENWAKRLFTIMPYVKKRKYSPNPNFTNINDPEGFKRYDSYKHLPVKTVRELEKISRNARANIDRIHCDVLWFHSKGDIAADFNSAKSFFEKIPSQNKTFVEYTKSNHIILFDYDSEDAIKRTIAFLKEIK
ncbi:alpha/beta fold hydrolase, partial [Candidatus Sumerlaeota bacterium]|nr:alpha/beta fold hydrolase [Candidatus Sumerlaeota bacterium]